MKQSTINYIKNTSVFLLVFIGILISLSAVQASTLNYKIDSQQANITALINQTTSIDINISSNSTKAMYNISLVEGSYPNYITFNKIDSLNMGETKILKINFNPQSKFTQNIAVKIRGYFFTQITKAPETKQINITSTLFIPNSITIYQDSSVSFNNIDGISHTIRSNLFSNQNIPSGSNFNYVFSAIGLYAICENTYNFCMNVNVIDKVVNELAFDEADDKTLNLNIESKYIDTVLGADIVSGDNLTMDYNIPIEGLIKITNIGSQTAKNIILSNDWFSFSKNNFDLNPSQSTYVSFIITPKLTQNSETNKSYMREISIKADNTEEIKKNMNIFVNYAIVSAPSGNFTCTSSDPNSYYCYQEFCSKFSNSTSCTGIVKTEYIYINNYTDKNMTLNIPESVILDWMRNSSVQKEINEKALVTTQEYADSTNAKLSAIENQTASSANDDAISRKKIEEMALWRIVFMIFVSVAGLMLIVLYVVYRKTRKEKTPQVGVA